MVMKNLIRFSVLGFVFAAAHFAAAQASPPPGTIVIDNSEAVLEGNWGIVSAYGGTVATSPNKSVFSPGEEVTFTAKANEGYVFDGWSGNAEGYRNPLRVVMNTNKTIIANFLAAGVGVIMDNTKVPEEDRSGKWQVSQQTAAGTWFDNHDFAVAKETADSTFTFRPNIPKAGKYDVYIRYAQGSNRSSRVPWKVSHKGGVVNAIVNQKSNGGEWVQIASSVEFENGTKKEQFAEVTNGTGAEPAGTVVVADAVAFVFVGQ